MKISATQIFRLVVILAVLGLSAIAIVWIFDTPSPVRDKRPPAPPPLVRVLEVTPANHTLVSIAHGEVLAADLLDIRPQVGGQLQYLHPAFEPGGVIPAGERIFEIEPTDYQLAVASAEAALARARADLEIEQGKRKVAREELRLLGDSITIDPASRELALRAPQLQQVRAQILQAENTLAEARTQLARTRLSMPYDLVVLSRDKVSGEILAERERIGEVARADRFWVELQVPPSLLGRLQLRTADTPGAKVRVRYLGREYPAEITRILPDLGSDSRQARVLAEVSDPLGKGPEAIDRPPLLIGSYVEAEIDSGRLLQVIEMPRSALHDNNRVWLVTADNHLEVREVEPVHIGDENVYLAPQPGLQHILLSSPSGLVPGAVVRIRQKP